MANSDLDQLREIEPNFSRMQEAPIALDGQPTGWQKKKLQTI